jgi:hypothetical protein
MAFPTQAPQSLRRLYNYLKKRATNGNAMSVAIALAAGAANVMGVTVTVKDEDGNPVKAVHRLDIYATQSATGAALTTSAFSGDLVATTGVIMSSPVAKKQWSVLTDVNGVFAGNLTDTGKPQDLYIAVRNPRSADVALSAISAGKFG